MSNLVNIPRLIDPVSVPAAPVADPMPIAAAYERVRADIEAVPDDALLALNVDVQAVVHTVRVALPTLLELRPAIASALPTFDLVSLDKLSDYAEALAFLHTEFKRSEKPVAQLPEMYEEAVAFRESVITVGRSLVRLELLDSTVFDRAGRVTGYANVAYELIGLCSTMLEKLPQLGARCPLTEAQLRRGQALSNLILSSQAEKARVSARVNSAQLNRQRAYTLLSRAWVQVRRAVAYLRWAEADADALVPSFYPGRGPVGRDESVESDESTDAASTDADARTDGATPVVARTHDKPGAPVDPTSTDTPRGDPLFTPVSDDPFVRA